MHRVHGAPGHTAEGLGGQRFPAQNAPPIRPRRPDGSNCSRAKGGSSAGRVR